jgi:ADP-heptose:LPS heptosyltransferase
LTNFTDLFGTTKNIFDLVELIKKSEVLICSDSAPMHIGVATSTRTIAIFGPTDNETLLPKDEKYTAITNNADCRPCLWAKRQTTCENLKCLDIDIEKIINLLK